MSSSAVTQFQQRSSALLSSLRFHLRGPHRWWVILGGVAFIILTVVGVAVGETYQAVRLAQNFELNGAARHARRARLLSQPLTALTAHRTPLIETWDNSLETLLSAQQLVTQTQLYLKTGLNYTPQASIEAVLLQNSVSEFKKNIVTLLSQIEKTPQLQQFVQSRLSQTNFNWEQFRTELPQFLTDFEALSAYLLTGQHSYIILFQNSHELRATGGFMGSYAKLDFNNGQLAEIDVQDIYEPDGQFQGFVAAPPGVNEYLSSGHGIRLPDSNWSPDFPSSAQNILNYFALGKKQAIEGVVSINLTVAEKILTITGPLYLPDYQVTVTAENLAEVARADRDQFFPGSQAKPHFLSALFTQLKLKLEQLTPAQQRSLLKLLQDSLINKDLQLFSTYEPMQAIFQKYQASGEILQHHSDAAYLFLVESNVGINKANQGITRQVKVDLGEYRSHVEVEFQNHNTIPAAPASELAKLLQPPSAASPTATQPYHYVNYQRVFIPADSTLANLTVDQKPITKIDENLITTARGQQFKQIGFLVTVVAQQKTQLSFDIVSKQPQTAPLAFEIQRQSGLPPTPYTVTFGSSTRDLLLEKDEIVTF